MLDQRSCFAGLHKLGLRINISDQTMGSQMYRQLKNVVPLPDESRSYCFIVYGGSAAAYQMMEPHAYLLFEFVES